MKTVKETVEQLEWLFEMRAKVAKKKSGFEIDFFRTGTGKDALWERTGDRLAELENKDTREKSRIWLAMRQVFSRVEFKGGARGCFCSFIVS